MAHDPIIITADEIHCLIYAYFQDAGFNHSAFALRNESRLYNSPYSSKHIPRGELIELLSKALLYLEVESHWRNDALTTNCKAGFSLLEPHICSLDPESQNEGAQAPQPNGVSATTHSHPSKPYVPPRRDASPPIDATQPHDTLLHPLQGLASVSELGSKRKTSPVPVEGPVGKRLKQGSVDFEANDSMSRGRSPVVPTPPPDLDSKDSSKALQRRKLDEKALMNLPGGTSEIFVCAFNPVKPNLIAAGQRDGSICIWDIPTPPDLDSPLYASPPENGPVVIEPLSEGDNRDTTSMDWSPDGKLLAVASYDAMLRIGTPDGQLYFSHPQHQSSIFCAKFSKSGRWLVTVSLDHTACVWDVQQKQVHRQYRYHKDCCLDAEWITEDTFASAGADSRILVMHVDQDEPIKILSGHKDEVNEICANPSGTRLASGSDDATAAIWKIDNLSVVEDAIPGLTASDLVVTLKGHTQSVNKVAWCPEILEGSNERVATISFDTTVRIWDTVTGACLRLFEDHNKPVYALTFSPDGKFFATGDADGALRIVQTKNYETLYSWSGTPAKPPIFDLVWQQTNGINRIALGRETGVALLDVNKLECYRDYVKGGNSDDVEESR